jgi:hypothetical protein
MTPIDRAELWRKRAEELRTLAETFRPDEEPRQNLLDLAAQWDRLAVRAAARAETSDV